MKHSKLPLLLLFAVVMISCASRPPAASTELELFEHALLNIKTNTPLVKKYLETSKGIITDAGVRDITEVVIKGICLIDGNEFHVTYDIASAVQNGETFRIPFSLEDRKNGVSHNDELFWTPAPDGAGLLLSFDDHFFRNWRNNFDLFDRYGAKVTFFITGGLDTNINTSPGEMSARDFCAEALRRGHGLGYHSRSHIDLTKVSRRTFDSETVAAVAAFSATGIPLGSFAYPFGFSEPWMRTALAPVFPVTRGYGTDIRIYNQETINNGYIISKAIDNTVYPNDSVFENVIRRMLLVTKFSGGIIPLTSHIIADGEEWGIKPKRLEFLLKTAGELRLRFYTFEEVARHQPTAR
jgi:peptidoglycan/xylan/chitin deacetylase (PgdA/CDA1 family)